MIAAWVSVVALIARHRIFVSHDTVSNYAHVWYVADRLWRAHRLPFAMPMIGHGHGLAFPYAFVPWMLAALAWPVLGEWAVTLTLVVGFAGVVVATFWAFPELRRGWWAAAVLVNPALVLAPIVGQLPFLWATASLLGAIGCWRRRRWAGATVLAGLAQATHPAVLIPIAAGLVVGRLRWEPRPRRLLVAWAVTVAAALPAAALVVASPVFTDSSTATKLGALFGTVLLRSAVVAVPIGLAAVVRRKPPAYVAPVVFVALLAPNLAVGPLDTRVAWQGLFRQPDTVVADFVRSPAFVPGATYRVLRAADGKIGMYQLIRGGGRLDSEFFPESIDRRSWPDARSYLRFLAARGVDYVLAFDSYNRRYPTNEIALLGDLAAAGDGAQATQAGHGVQATQAGHGVQATQAGHGVQATQAGHGVQATQAGRCVERAGSGPGYVVFQVHAPC